MHNTPIGWYMHARTHACACMHIYIPILAVITLWAHAQHRVKRLVVSVINYNVYICDQK